MLFDCQNWLITRNFASAVLSGNWYFIYFTFLLKPKSMLHSHDAIRNNKAASLMSSAMPPARAKARKT